MKILRSACSLLLAVLPLLTLADAPDPLTQEQQRYDDSADKQVSARMVTRISQDFSTLLASEENPESVVAALRSGERFSYQQQTLQAPGGMGYGNVFLTLALTEQNGGNMEQILTMRQNGMGWGEIAQALDTRVGAVVSRIKASHSTLQSVPYPPSPPQQSPSPERYHPSGSGIVDGMGNPITSGDTRGRPQGAEKNSSGNHSAVGRGITSGMNHGGGNGKGHGYGHDKASK